MAEKYQILARKYRPQIFKDVVGQDTIVQTIKNSLKYQRIAHAYLFSGTRGTGKTTLARLFAKALNCQNLKDEIEPCNECQSCTEIATSRSLDVIEIDGASNRGIDDIRQINDTIGYNPSGKYKIYIIDEVHMLTKEAFNALLKTLEEPPENIKFFFATTEAHRVLPTIISRCQRFELKRITNELIIAKLEKISLDLDRQVEKDALYQISNFSEGSLRDAESLLDQIFCYQEGDITLQYINQALGFIDHDYFFELDKKISSKNTYCAFEFVDKIHSWGKDLSYLVEELLDHFKNLLVLKLNQNSLSVLSEEMRQKYRLAQELYSEEQLFYILDILTNAVVLHKNSFKRIHLETLLLKIIKSKNILPIDVLVQRLLELEKTIQAKEEAPMTQPRSAPPQKEIALPQNHTSPPQAKIPSPHINNSPPKEDIVLEKIAFSLDKKPIQTDQKNQSHYDTLLRFAQVELDGINKT